jgi:phage-related protein
VSPFDKPLVWLGEEVRSPPLSHGSRLELGFLLRRLQRGDTLTMPVARAMPSIGKGVAELRVVDGNANAEWRLIYRVDTDAIVVAAVFQKKSQATPKRWIETSQARFRRYDTAKEG